MVTECMTLSVLLLAAGRWRTKQVVNLLQ